MRQGAFLVGLVGAMLGVSAVFAEVEPSQEIPEAFLPFQHMIGSWKGTCVPTANRQKGWSETHRWAWKFVKGNPVGMTVELEGDKPLTKAAAPGLGFGFGLPLDPAAKKPQTKGQLTFDAASKRYRLEAADHGGKSVAFVAMFDKARKSLVLDRVGTSADGKHRVLIRPNSNMIRYVLEYQFQEAGAPQYKKVTEVGLTKEGESFAAGGSAADLPKCILTGGAATMTVSYQGKSYPVCCSGCREEFNDNPEKYAKKAALMAEQGGGKAPVKSASSKVGKDDGSFDGLVDEEKPAPAPKKPARTTTKKDSADTEDDPAPAKPAAGKTAAKAASQLRLGQSLEKSGKTAAALKYYKQIVKDFPGTPQAKTAAARIKALSTE